MSNLIGSVACFSSNDNTKDTSTKNTPQHLIHRNIAAFSLVNTSNNEPISNYIASKVNRPNISSELTTPKYPCSNIQSEAIAEKGSVNTGNRCGNPLPSHNSCMEDMNNTNLSSSLTNNEAPQQILKSTTTTGKVIDSIKQRIETEETKEKIDQNGVSQTHLSSDENSTHEESVSLSQVAPIVAKRLFDESDMATDSTPTCRFCLEEDSESNLIQPCLCDGSSKWVHRTCLNNWRAANTALNRGFFSCEVCLYAFKMEQKYNSFFEQWEVLFSADVLASLLAFSLVVKCLADVVVSFWFEIPPWILSNALDNAILVAAPLETVVTDIVPAATFSSSMVVSHSVASTLRTHSQSLISEFEGLFAPVCLKMALSSLLTQQHDESVFFSIDDFTHEEDVTSRKTAMDSFREFSSPVGDTHRNCFPINEKAQDARKSIFDENIRFLKTDSSSNKSSFMTKSLTLYQEERLMLALQGLVWCLGLKNSISWGLSLCLSLYASKCKRPASPIKTNLNTHMRADIRVANRQSEVITRMSSYHISSPSETTTEAEVTEMPTLIPIVLDIPALSNSSSRSSFSLPRTPSQSPSLSRTSSFSSRSQARTSLPFSIPSAERDSIILSEGRASSSASSSASLGVRRRSSGHRSENNVSASAVEQKKAENDVNDIKSFICSHVRVPFLLPSSHWLWSASIFLTVSGAVYLLSVFIGFVERRMQARKELFEGLSDVDIFEVCDLRYEKNAKTMIL